MKRSDGESAKNTRVTIFCRATSTQNIPWDTRLKVNTPLKEMLNAFAFCLLSRGEVI